MAFVQPSCRTVRLVKSNPALAHLASQNLSLWPSGDNHRHVSVLRIPYTVNGLLNSNYRIPTANVPRAVSEAGSDVLHQ